MRAVVLPGYVMIALFKLDLVLFFFSGMHAMDDSDSRASQYPAIEKVAGGNQLIVVGP